MNTLPEGRKEKYYQKQNKILSQKELGLRFQTSSTLSSGHGVSSVSLQLRCGPYHPMALPKELELHSPFLFVQLLHVHSENVFGELPSN